MVRVVGMPFEVRERGSKANTNVHESGPNERWPNLHGSVYAEDGLQHRLSGGGRRMVQMVGMVGVRHRLHAHQEKIL